MADQASVRVGNTDPVVHTNGTPEGRVVGGITEFGNDVVNLVELQAKLALLDLKDCASQVAKPLALVAGGLSLILGTIPVLLLGVAALVATALNISNGWAQILTGGIVLITSAIIVGVAAMRIVPSFSSFRRSSEEFQRNAAWLRTILLYSGRNVARRGR
jgi:uncharacterized membrane protein YqjE